MAANSEEKTTGHNAGIWEKPPPSLKQWATAVSPEVIAAAKRGQWEIQLTPSVSVPASWLGGIAGSDLLGLAAGGGQQGPLLAAAGANVTTLDISQAQLDLDLAVATRDGLKLRVVHGDMRDLSMFDDACFDTVIFPSAISYIDEPQQVWNECHRVLKPGGALLAGFTNPWVYIFDWASHTVGNLVVRHPLPFSDADDLPSDERQAFVDDGTALEWSHTLESLIGGQLKAGFKIEDMFEDRQEALALAKFVPTSIATRSVRPK